MSERDSDPAAAQVLTRKSGSVLVVTLNRPTARNAATRAMAMAVAAAIDLLEEDHELSAAVLTGSEGNFCAGMDLKGFLADETPRITRRGFLAVTERPPTKPLIAAVEGYALAGGFETALACDLIVASRTARFGLPETKRGLVAAAGGLMRLPDRIPENVAMELALTGDMIDVERAHALGLVNRVTEPGEALAEAIALAETISANGPVAVRVSKRVVRESRDWPTAERHGRQATYVDPVFDSDDAAEGARAFAEKRPARWVGH